MSDGELYQVRRVRTDDWREQRRLRLEALKDSPTAFVTQYDDAAAEPDTHWRNRTRDSATGNSVATFVAVAGDGFVGMATGLVEDDTTGAQSPAAAGAHVVGVYVTPQWRGTRVAEELVAAVVAWAEQDVRADRIRLFVMETNERAAAFYRRVGFVRTGNTMDYPPDPTYQEHEMVYRPST